MTAKWPGKRSGPGQARAVSGEEGSLEVSPGKNGRAFPRGNGKHGTRGLRLRMSHGSKRRGTSFLVPRVFTGELSYEVQKPATRRESTPTSSGVIDIDLGHARVRIEGAVNADCVRAALEGLLR